MARKKLGPIADSYSELQGLPTLEKARSSVVVKQATYSSAIRAILQAAEVCLVNLSDLYGRARNQIIGHGLETALTQLLWARGFNDVLHQLSQMPLRLEEEMSLDPQILRIRDSSNLARYLNNLKEFDSAVKVILHNNNAALISIAERSLDDPLVATLHLSRICNQETIIWESKLANVRIPKRDARGMTYDEFVDSDSLYTAVYERRLDGETFFTQFRGMHQVPEILTREINEQISAAGQSLDKSAYIDALWHLQTVNVLFQGVLSAIRPIADSLATADYHVIRDYLGQTSATKT